MHRQVLILCLLTATAIADHPDVMVFAPARDPGDTAHRAAVDAVVNVFNRKRRVGLKVHTPRSLRLERETSTPLPVLKAFISKGGVLFYYRGELRLDGQKNVLLTAGTGDLIPLKQLVQSGNSPTPDQPVIVLDASTASKHTEVLASCERVVSATSERLELLVNLRSVSESVSPYDSFGTNLALGLAGHADKDGDTAVTTSELFRFTAQRCPKGSVRRMRSQPAMKAGPREVWKLHPRTMDELAADIAAETARYLHKHKISAVAIPDLIADEHSTLPRICLTTLKKELLARSGYQYRILATDWLQPKLVESLVTPENVQSPKMASVFRTIGEQCPNSKAAVLLGTLTRSERSKPSVRLALTPWGADGTPAPDIAGTAMLTPREWAHLGKSAVNQTAMAMHYAAPSASADAVEGEVSLVRKKPLIIRDYSRASDAEATEQLIDSLEDARQRHPMADPSFEFRMSLWVDGKPMPSSWSHDKRRLYTPLIQGEDYAIRVTNDSRKPVFMRLLVDGLNTLPDRPLTTRQDEYEVATVDESAARAPAQYANLRIARPWWVEAGTYQVDGFFTGFEAAPGSKEADGKYRTFHVTDATSSLAWNKGYKKDVGIVTAVFYSPTRKITDLAPNSPRGTTFGISRNRKVTMYRGDQMPGDMLAVIHIHYGIDPPSGETNLVTAAD